MWLLLPLVLCLHCAVPSLAEGTFTLVQELGAGAGADTDVVGVVFAPDGEHAFVAGTTAPKGGSPSSGFGAPAAPTLRGADFFVAKVAVGARRTVWAFRYGTGGDDRAGALLLAPGGGHLYVGGATLGAFGGARAPGGLADAFVAKFAITPSGLAPAWPAPLVLRSAGRETVTALAADPADPALVYVVGYTSGALFRRTGGGVNDGFAAAVRAKDGALAASAQFSGPRGTMAMAAVVARGGGGGGEGSKGLLLVAAQSERLVGETAVSNLHLFRLSLGSLASRGDTLHESFATERVAAALVHPALPGALLAAGTAKMDETRRDDVLVKRVPGLAGGGNGTASLRVAPGALAPPAYSARIGGTAFEYAGAAALHASSGALLLAGHGTGALGPSSLGPCDCRAAMAPFLARVHPATGELLDVAHAPAPPDSWADAAALAVAPDGAYTLLAGRVLNKTTSRYHAVLTQVALPQHWQTALDVADSPSPAPSPSVAPRQAQFPLVPVVAGAGGGTAALVALLVVACCCCCRPKQA